MNSTNAVGRRKTAVARVFLKKGSGNILINGKDSNSYFSVPHLRTKILLPLDLIEGAKEFDFQVNVNGGGIKGQADAIKLAIARTLVKENGENRPVLKKAGLLVRDARKVERKKPGLRKARKRSQFSKR